MSTYSGRKYVTQKKIEYWLLHSICNKLHSEKYHRSTHRVPPLTLAHMSGWHQNLEMFPIAAVAVSDSSGQNSFGFSKKATPSHFLSYICFMCELGPRANFSNTRTTLLGGKKCGGEEEKIIQIVVHHSDQWFKIELPLRSVCNAQNTLNIFCLLSKLTAKMCLLI